MFTRIDWSNAIFFLSVGAVAWGIWQISPAAAAIIIGGLFVTLAVYGFFAGKEKRP